MAIPIVYNLRSLRARWVSAIVAVLGIAGTVGVFLAMLGLARGFRATLVSSGSPDNVLIRRSGAGSELDGAVPLEQVRVLEDKPAIAREGGQPLISPEAVVIAPFPLITTGTDANVQIRGVTPIVLKVRKNVRIVRGRFFRPGLAELVIGRNVASTYGGLDLGKTVKFGGGTWTIVGVFDAGGSAFDSEIWSDVRVLNQTYKRPDDLYQSVTATLTSPAAFDQLKDSITADPTLTVQVDREADYYARQSEVLTTLITVLGTLVAIIMGVGAVFGALNTMYSAVAERGREIATMRAIGFGSASIVISFLFEALLIAFIGGLLGAIAVLKLNGLTTSTLNMQTFSSVAFAFHITPMLMLIGIVFALFMGLIGGVPPAIRAARRPVALALREL
ncbi:MAG TPA: ABC transporter permease [Candidatus Acidoferrales bacterium]|jgi:putative ABC transport system permease protein|nr:ABC transporter permease [Candidatus Acidoferrales bacterium]